MIEAIGQQFGPYRLLRLLGTGNFASVYLGEHQYLERPAAIKVLRVRMGQEADAPFRREARTIAHLDHPHIVRVYDFGIQEQTPFLVMEYTPNGSLRTRHPKGTCLPLEQIATYVKQIASSLDYAHEHRVIHRDVKPENLLLNAKGEIVLSDFGIAVVQQTLASLSEQNMAGTPLYMAPEQIRHQPSPQSDQYALGIMVYEWLCGEPPFQGTFYEMLSQHLHQAPPSLRARVSSLPPAVEDAVFGALAKDPTQRFPTVQDFATVLEEACLATQPLVLRGVQDQDTLPLAPSVLLPAHPSSGRDGAAASSPVLISPRRRASEQEPVPLTIPGPVTQSHLASQQTKVSATQRDRQTLLRKVYSFWINGVLSRSLHGAALMTLGLETQPDAVANPWHLVLQHPDTAPRPLPTGTRIQEVYDDAQGELLILGAPGAGKTTLLLELARHLLERAKQDEQHPMPVVFNLSSWAMKQQSLTDWLVEELNTKYQVPSKLGQALVETDQILPLLDGLDEVAPTARTACIEAINTYRQEHGLLPLVVCSRQADYLSQTARVLVRSAVLVQPLTQEQVDAYLEQGGEALGALRAALNQDATLRELTSTPLMLSILTLTYHGKPVEELLRDTSLEERQQQIFKQYVGRMLTRRGPLQAGTPELVVKWLAFLAARMRERNQTVFYLEQLQPDWLPAGNVSTYIWTGIRVPAILLGILASLLVMTYFGGSIEPVQLLTPAVLGGFLGWLWSLSFTQGSTLASGTRAPGTMWKKRLIASLCTGLLVSFSFENSFNAWLAYGLFSVAFIASGSLCLLHLFLLPTKSSSMWSGLPPLRFLRSVSVPRAFLVAAAYGLSIGLFSGLASWLYSGLRLSTAFFYVLYDGLYYGLVLGLVSLLIGWIVPAQADTVRLTERVRWTRSSLKKSLSSPRHL
ncbi:MAG: protein kinase, partial [Chloroflexi bacterium]|nr:protein kinase [Chloroflexota bacterium]